MPKLPVENSGDNEPSASPIELVFRVYLLSCQTDRQLSEKTIDWYRRMLQPLVDRLHGTDIARITPNMLREYIASLQGRRVRYEHASQRPTEKGGLSVATLAGHIRALRVFFRWAQQEYGLKKNPATPIQVPRPKRHEPKAIPLENTKALLTAAERVKTDVARRDLAMMAFLADTGCRAGGLLGLTLDNLNLTERLAVVTEKGDRARAVPFTAYTAIALHRWLAVRPKGAGVYVFCALSNGFFGAPLTHSGLRTALNRWAKIANVKGRVNAHSFRHGFARAYLQNHGDLATLAQIMGHSSVEVTAAFYAVFTDRELQKFHRQFGPLSSMERSDKSDD